MPAALAATSMAWGLGWNNSREPADGKQIMRGGGRRRAHTSIVRSVGPHGARSSYPLGNYYSSLGRFPSSTKTNRCLHSWHSTRRVIMPLR